MEDEVIQISEILNSTWSHAAVWFGALWAIYLFINKVSKDAEEVLNPEKMKALSDELLRIKDRDISSWVPDFTSVFDRFFGENHLSWRCFSRSLLISISVFSALLFLYIPDFIFQSKGTIDIFLFIIFLAAIFNVVLDYISLLETRIILTIPAPILVKIFLDAILTLLLTMSWSVVVVTVSLLSVSKSAVWSDISLDSIYLFWLGVFSNSSQDGSKFYYIVIATSFTTSIWLWLHGLSFLAIRTLSNVQKFMGWLNVKETPLRAIGTTINLIVLTFGVLLFPVYLFY